jgi:hypothetical protein
MAQSDNLKITYIDGNQNQKYVTANEAFNQIDKAFNSGATVGSLVGDAYIDEVTFTNAFFFTLEDATTSPNLTGAFEVIVPELPRFFAIYNSTGFEATIRSGVTAGATVTVDQQQIRYIYSDGTDLYDLGSAAVGGPYDPTLFFAGSPVGGQTILSIRTSRPFTLFSGLPGTQVYAEFEPQDGDWVLEIEKNDVAVGDITITNNTNDSFSVTFGSDVSFAVGDRLSLIAPNPADSNLGNLSVTLKGSRG